MAQVRFEVLDAMDYADFAGAVQGMTPARRKAAYKRYEFRQRVALGNIPQEFMDTPISELRARDDDWAVELHAAYDRMFWFGVGAQRALGPDWLYQVI